LTIEIPYDTILIPFTFAVSIATFSGSGEKEYIGWQETLKFWSLTESNNVVRSI